MLAGLLTEAGLPTTFEDCMTGYRGRSITSVLAIAARRFGGPLPLDIAERYYADVEAVFARELEPVPGVVEALNTGTSSIGRSASQRRLAIHRRRRPVVTNRPRAINTTGTSTARCVPARTAPRHPRRPHGYAAS